MGRSGEKIGEEMKQCGKEGRSGKESGLYERKIVGRSSGVKYVLAH